MEYAQAVMNSQPPPHAAELALHQTLKRVEDFVRREPAKATIAAFGAGLVLHMLPPRMIAGVTAAIATGVLPPALLGLGVLKAFEICCEKDSAESL